MHKVALISTNKSKFSETFIQKHREMLPFEVHYLYGGYLPNYYGEGFQFLEGIDYPELEVERFKEIKWQLQEAIGNYLTENGIQAVLTEYGLSGVEMMDICEHLNIPLIVHFHGFDAYRDDVMQHYGERYPALFQKAKAVVVVSKHMQRRLEALGCPPEKIVWNPCGADNEMFVYNDLVNRENIFLTVGRFDDIKAPHLAILAFAAIFKTLPKWKMVMIGDGHLLESCKTLAKSLGVSDVVEFRGVQNHNEVAAFMQKAKVFIQHSITTTMNDTEGTPVAVLEASLSGLPVVATKHGGIPDVIIHGETGFLVDESDFKGMAKCMLQLANDEQFARRIGEGGHRNIQSHFILRHHIDKLAGVINSCILQSGKVQQV